MVFSSFIGSYFPLSKNFSCPLSFPKTSSFSLKKGLVIISLIIFLPFVLMVIAAVIMTIREINKENSKTNGTRKKAPEPATTNQNSSNTSTTWYRYINGTKQVIEEQQERIIFSSRQPITLRLKDNNPLVVKGPNGDFYKMVAWENV